MTGGAQLGGAAIVGLGITDVGKVYGRSVTDFAVDAVQRAVADCGLVPSDVDGIITSYGMSGAFGSVPASLGMRNLGLNVNMFAAGATATAAIQYAASAVATGMARNVVYVHADAPLQDPTQPSGSSYATGQRATGMRTIPSAVGLTSPNAFYALAARRHMNAFGTTSEQLGAIAVAQRAWAADNPLARFRTPMTIDDHQSSRMIADPLHLLDCCMVSNGAIAFVLTSEERARDMPQPPVHVLGWGQGHPTYAMSQGSAFGLVSGAVQSGAIAFAMAGVKLSDIDQAQIYDCYTFTVLITLEDYGFCAKGEGGSFVASGALNPGGSLPVNTGGGQLSAYYLWGATPLSEAVIQGRGQGGDRQAARNDLILVSGNGGILDHHGTLILSPHGKV
jgi:acetyl-CoA acetyltransferase